MEAQFFLRFLMKTSQFKRSRWMYISLGIMLFALICFSLAPLVSSIIKSKPSNSHSSPINLSEQLNSQALGYELVLQREPNNQNALKGLLEVRLKQGDLQSALNPLEQLAQLNPQQPDYMLLLAQAKQQLQDYDGAIGTYRTILAAHPQEIRALQGWSALLVTQERYPEAITLVQTYLKNAIAAKTNPDNISETLDLTSLQLLLGEIYLAQKQYNQAIAIYEQAIKADSQDFRPVLAKALVLQEQGQNNEAEPLFTQAITLAPLEYKDQIKAMAGEKTSLAEESKPET